MTKRIREALERIEKEIAITEPRTMSSQYAQFLDDLWTLIYYIRLRERGKRV